MRLDPPPSGEESVFQSVEDDSLFGKRLIRSKNKVREFTEKEYAEEKRLLDQRNKAFVVDNMVQSKLNATRDLVLPDYFDSLPEATKKEIKDYRDALRAVKYQQTYPEKVIFPDELKL